MRRLRESPGRRARTELVPAKALPAPAIGGCNSWRLRRPARIVTLDGRGEPTPVQGLKCFGPARLRVAAIPAERCSGPPGSDRSFERLPPPTPERA